MITESMEARAGKLLNAEAMRIEQRMVDEYLDATGDPDRVWRNKSAAREAGYRDVPVPPGLLTSMQMEGGSPSAYMPEQAHLGGAVDGGGEWEFYLPVYMLLEIDANDGRLFVFSRWDLGTDPLDVLDVLTARGDAGS